MTVASTADNSPAPRPSGAAGPRAAVERSGNGGPEGPALGTTRSLRPDSVDGPDPALIERTREWRQTRFVRRQQSAEWLIWEAREQAGMPPVAPPGTRYGSDEWVNPPRPAKCRWRVGEQVSVHHDEGGAAHYGGLMRCGSIWACPVCASVLRAERAADIGRAVAGWQDQGNALVFVTLTLRHREGDPLRDSMGQLLEGWRKVQSGRWWQDMKARFGIRGSIRAVEVTLGENGWHPHLHVLFFCDRPVEAGDAAEWESLLYSRWADAVTKVGGRLPSRMRGVDVRPATADGRVVGQYLAKLQDEGHQPKKTSGVASELARFDMKGGRRGSMTPFELLDVVHRADADDDRAAMRLWCEYVAATRGKSAIRWTKGLRELCDMDDPEKTDDEILDEAECSDFRFLIPGGAYDALLKNDPVASALVLRLVEEGRIRQAMELVGGYVPQALVDWRTGEVRAVG